jgi:ATP-binding cassette, subfamily C (CFTR/MRP), member 4
MDSTAKEKLEVNPRKTGNFLSILTFSWVLPLLFKGRKKVLDCDDLEKSWLNEIEKKKRKNQKPSLMSAGLSVFGLGIFYRGTLLLIFELAFRVTLPMFLGGVIQYFDKPEEESLNEAYLYATGIIVCSFCSVIANHALMLSNLAMGMRIRIAACSLIYRKALKLSKCALINTTSGQIVNLLSNDVGRSVKCNKNEIKKLSENFNSQIRHDCYVFPLPLGWTTTNGSCNFINVQ